MKAIRTVLCMVLCAFVLCGTTGGVQATFEDYPVTELDVEQLDCDILENRTARAYVNSMIRYYLLDSEYASQMLESLGNGQTVLFFFEGCSDHVGPYQSYTETNYFLFRLGAVVVAIRNVNGIPTIVFMDQDTTTLPDRPRDASVNDGSPVPTVVDGVYMLRTANHGTGSSPLGRYASLQIGDQNGVSVVRCSEKGSYLSSSKYIHIHGRTRVTVRQKNGQAFNGVGCFMIGTGDHTQYNTLIELITGVADAIGEETSDNHCYAAAGEQIGMVVVDRSTYRTQLQDIYGSDGSNTAEELTALIVGDAFKDNQTISEDVGRISVTLFPMGGSVDTRSLKVTFGQPYEELPVPDRSGYIFDGWYTSSVGGVEITEETEMTSVAPVRLYARWTKAKKSEARETETSEVREQDVEG